MNKHFLIFSLLHLVLFFACSAVKNPAGKGNQRFFIGTATNEEEEGIYSATFDPLDGTFSSAQRVSTTLNPGFLTVAPNQRFLYAVNGVKGQSEGGVTAYQIQSRSGVLKPINDQPSNGRGPCYISIVPSGNWALVANYSSGSISVFPVGKDGSLGPASDVRQHHGSGPDQERQEGPHAHYVRAGPGGLIYAADLGTDEIVLYQLDEQSGKLQQHLPKAIKVGSGRGPRHLDFHPNGKYIYVLNELTGSVSVFERKEDNSQFTERQTITTLPQGFGGYNKSADIHVHSNGRWVYASNRGDHNSIAVFSIEEESGLLSLVEIEEKGIKWPRNFAIDPSGKFLLVANRDDDSIASFRIEPGTGALSATDHRIVVPQPICLQFVNLR